MPARRVAHRENNNRLSAKMRQKLSVAVDHRDFEPTISGVEIITDVSPKRIASGFSEFFRKNMLGDEGPVKLNDVERYLEIYLEKCVPAISAVQEIQSLSKRKINVPKFRETEEKTSAIEFFEKHYLDDCRSGVINIYEIQKYDNPFVATLYAELRRNGQTLSEFIGKDEGPSKKILAVSAIINGSLDDASKFVGHKSNPGGRPRK